MRSIKEIFKSYGVLDERGVHTNGTDKETNHHYGDAYEQLFWVNEWVDVQITNYRSEPFCRPRSIRKDIKLMMEVGIADGSSLLAWRDIFPNAQCVGLDVHHSDKAYGERIEFHLGDQRSLEDCKRAARGRLFDFICEDATHQLQDSLVTLFYLWPSVKPGGLYIIEEFANVGALRENIKALFPFAQIIDTQGPFGGIEPLVILRKPI